MKKILAVIISIITYIILDKFLIEFVNADGFQIEIMIQYRIILFSSLLLIAILFEDAVLSRIYYWNAEKEQHTQEYNYYKDPLNEISPMMGALLLKKKIDNPDVVAAMILYMKNLGIKLDKNYKPEDLKNIKLRKHEKFFALNKDILFSGFFNDAEVQYGRNETYTSFLRNCVRDDLLDEGYVKENKKIMKTYPTLLLPFFYFVFLWMLTGWIPYSATCAYSIIVKTIYSIVILAYIFINVFVYSYDVHFVTFLTSKGMNYIEKTKAAKRFLQDYSRIHDREVKQEILLDTYVQNAIFLDLKGNLDEDASEFYYNILKKYQNTDSAKTFLIVNNKFLTIFLIIYAFVWIWVPMEPAANLSLFLFFGGIPIFIVQTNLFSNGTPEPIDERYNYMKTKKSEDEIIYETLVKIESEKRVLERKSMIDNNTLKINEALKNRYSNNENISIKNIHETDKSIEDILKEASDIDGDGISDNDIF